ncbi:MAG: hypothetical protein JXB23_02725 [Candidatus Aminicenantes bacterium]|nr:hypothetical protein [Candidatus Aminicenantes bacterium]
MTNQIAIKSAVMQNQPDEVLLLHDGLSEGLMSASGLIKDCRMRLEEASEDWFDDLPRGGEEMRALYNAHTSPTAKANLLRLAVLWKLGGIYLDMDTVTIKSFDGLRKYRGFCGCETVAVPGDLLENANLITKGRVGIKLAFRELCVYIPKGYRLFKTFESLYAQSVNNAVMGSAPKNPFLEKAFSAIKEMPENERFKRYGLGTHLLQRLTKNTSSENMEVLDRSFFYPLGPVISYYWFKKNSGGYYDDLLQENTVAVHWYNTSLRKFRKRSLDIDYLKKNSSTAFAKLVSKYLVC